MADLPSAAVKLIACQLVLVFLAAVALLLRFIAIYIRKRPLRLHDWLSVVSLLSLIGYIAVIQWGAVNGGLGLHVSELSSPSQVVNGLKAFYASTYFFTTVTAANRLCILALLVEVFRRKSFLIAAYVATAIVIAWWVGSMLTSLLLCRPISANWDKTIPATCGDTFKVELASASWNLILDLTLVILPMPVVWGLQMSTSRKIGISSAFALGIIIAGINIGRIVQTSVVDQADFTYAAIDASILATAEAAIGLIVACVPLLGPVVAPQRFGKKAYSDQQALNRKPYTGYHGFSDATAAGGRSAGSHESKASRSNRLIPRGAQYGGSGTLVGSEDDVEMLVQHPLDTELHRPGIAVTKSVHVFSEQRH